MIAIGNRMVSAPAFSICSDLTAKVNSVDPSFFLLPIVLACAVSAKAENAINVIKKRFIVNWPKYLIFNFSDR